jgi:hypothetical protein
MAAGIITAMPKRILFLGIALLWSCSKEVVQNSADLGEVRSLEEVISRVQTAYEKGNIEAFLNYFSLGSRDAGTIRQQVKESFESYPERRLSLAPKGIWIGGKEASVTVRWEGRWGPPSPKESFSQNGVALFVLLKNEKEEYQVSAIRGENPFLVDQR